MSEAGRSATLRAVPSCVALAFFLLMIVLYTNDSQLYHLIFTMIGIKPWSHPFIDGEFMYVMKDSWLHGVDIYKAVPADVVPGNRMAYSPLWPRLPFLPADKSWSVPVALVTDATLIISATVFAPVRKIAEAFLMSLALISTMVCFALERNNIDVWLFQVILVVGCLFSRGTIGRFISYVLISFIGLLKYYPFVLFALALRERFRVFIAVGILAVCVLASFIGVFRGELIASLSGVPTGPATSDMIGIVNIPQAVGNLSADVLNLAPDQRVALRLLMRLGLTAGVVYSAWRLFRRPELQRSYARLGEVRGVWLTIGCLLMAGCYLTGQSVGYRGIYLLFVLGGLISWQQVVVDESVKRLLRRTSITIIVLMWMEALRLWAVVIVGSIGLPPLAERATYVAMWLLRELLWLDLCRVMAAVLLTFYTTSPTGIWVYEHLIARWRSAIG